MNILIGLLALLSFNATAFADQLADQRSAFLQAEKYLAEKNEARFLEVSASLKNYVLYPYLQYEWLKDNLTQTDQVLTFLATYKDSRYSALLRSRWLSYLADQERWQDFARYYEVNDDNANDCRWLWAKYQTGKQQQTLKNAERLWLSGHESDKNCQALFSVLEKSPSITPEMSWQRFEEALKNNHLATAKATSLLLNPNDRKAAEYWLQLHQKPELLTESRFWEDKNARTGRLYVHAIKRLANVDFEKAMINWEASHHNFSLENDYIRAVEGSFGMALLGQKDNRAFEHLSKASLDDADIRTAKVRAALLEQNWQHVNRSLADLTTNERQEPKWQYWLARALHETGKKQQANTVYTTLAKDRSFYGFLAADTVDLAYQIVDIPVKVDEDGLKQLSGHPDFQACREFKWLNRDVEVRRQWQFAIKNRPKEELLVAAKLAQQWQWNQIAITTLVKADYWDDMALRFPVVYLNEIQANAEKHGLDPALLYGLIRQESMLDKNAVSSVGAKGLMQLMPETAKTVARALHESLQSNNDLFNPELNIKYGSYYLKDLINKYAGHVPVATAAYNAGPNRAKKWLPIASAVPADIWIETIPFKETRKYVSTVLSYAIIYQHRLKKSNLKLKNLLRDVTPRIN
ncbi:MAG: transglycosylase SLT domain-containing protein [Methyloglobulus sp.]